MKRANAPEPLQLQFSNLDPIPDEEEEEEEEVDSGRATGSEPSRTSTALKYDKGEDADDEGDSPGRLGKPKKKGSVKFLDVVDRGPSRADSGVEKPSPPPVTPSDLTLLSVDDKSPAEPSSPKSDSSTKEAAPPKDLSPKNKTAPGYVSGFGERARKVRANNRKAKAAGGQKSQGFNGEGGNISASAAAMPRGKPGTKLLAPIMLAKRHAAQWRSLVKTNRKRQGEPTGAATREPLQFLPPVRRARGSEVINPTVNGMRSFGIGKLGISRAVVKFSEPPASQPFTVCFHFPATFLTHRYVLDIVRSKIHFIGGATVKTVQFIDRNVIHGTQGLDNRWLVTVSSVEARDEVLRLGLHLYNRRINVRKYDDILTEEYKEYQQYMELQKKLYAKMEAMKKMMAEASGQGRAPPGAEDEIAKAMKELNKTMGKAAPPRSAHTPAARAESRVQSST